MAQFLENVEEKSKHRYRGILENGQEVSLCGKIHNSFFIDDLRDGFRSVNKSNPWIDRLVKNRLSKQFDNQKFCIRIYNKSVISRGDDISSLYVSYDFYMRTD